MHLLPEMWSALVGYVTTGCSSQSLTLRSRYGPKNGSVMQFSTVLGNSAKPKEGVVVQSRLVSTIAILEDGLEHFTLFPVAPGCQGQFGCAVVVRTTQRGSQTCEKHARTRSE